jgi:hypothetical protein
MQIIVNNSMQGKHKVAIFCASNIKVKEINLAGFFNTVPKLTNLESGRLTVTRIITEDLTFIILNFYASNDAQSRRSLFRTLTALIRQLDGLYILANN